MNSQKKITVNVASSYGCSLVESMEEQYPNIEWNITPEYGTRSLRIKTQ